MTEVTEWSPNWIDESNTDDLSELDGVDLSSEVSFTYDDQIREMNFDDED